MTRIAAAALALLASALLAGPVGAEEDSEIEEAWEEAAGSAEQAGEATARGAEGAWDATQRVANDFGRLAGDAWKAVLRSGQEAARGIGNAWSNATGEGREPAVSSGPPAYEPYEPPAAEESGEEYDW